eukprot:CAMPEP_0172619482 /NCGR_PEP_ID=MMETSP1068-20121228/93722_1 /TAXON_ID=35684 /ORGANISM="Pseudopedinella elastica, Strain CCMP716" /LENGTH=134 /DNA_ID=CAMNT_0013426251 /DNA_START=64 /DNA_END=468 /DNA_ORIENTATION=-
MAFFVGAPSALVSRPGPMAVSRRGSNRNTLSMEYVPSGMTKDQWAKLKAKEATNKKIGKFDGTSGMKFRSRSFEDFQKGREAGTLKYAMPMEFAKQKLAAGKIKPADIPYMQRPGGRPDGSDLRKGFKFPWQKA